MNTTQATLLLEQQLFSMLDVSVQQELEAAASASEEVRNCLNINKLDDHLVRSCKAFQAPAFDLDFVKEVEAELAVTPHARIVSAKTQWHKLTYFVAIAAIALVCVVSYQWLQNSGTDTPKTTTTVNAESIPNLIVLASLDNGAKAAVIDAATGESQIVTVGTQFGAYEVMAVNATQVRVKAHGKEQTFPLTVYSVASYAANDPLKPMADSAMVGFLPEMGAIDIDKLASWYHAGNQSAYLVLQAVAGDEGNPMSVRAKSALSEQAGDEKDLSTLQRLLVLGAQKHMLGRREILVSLGNNGHPLGVQFLRIVALDSGDELRFVALKKLLELGDNGIEGEIEKLLAELEKTDPEQAAALRELYEQMHGTGR